MVSFFLSVCHKHASLVIQPEQYEVVGKYLLLTMGDMLGETFTAELKEAWAKAYWQLADMMVGRERQLYQEDPTWSGWREFTIKKKEPESSEITSFYLMPVDGKPLPSYHPGQYISIRVLVDAKTSLKQPRQYSLSSSPDPTAYRISVRRAVPEKENVPNPSLISQILHDRYQVNDIVELSHPRGVFVPPSDVAPDAPFVFLGAGVGITPLLSMLETASLTPTRPVVLVHGATSTAQRAFTSEIRGLIAQQPREKPIQYVSFVSHPGPNEQQGKDYDAAGRVTLSKLDSATQLYSSNPSTVYFLCGPPRFMDDMSAALQRELGVQPDQIKAETFTETK